MCSHLAGQLTRTMRKTKKKTKKHFLIFYCSMKIKIYNRGSRRELNTYLNVHLKNLLGFLHYCSKLFYKLLLLHIKDKVFFHLHTKRSHKESGRRILNVVRAEQCRTRGVYHVVCDVLHSISFDVKLKCHHLVTVCF